MNSINRMGKGVAVMAGGAKPLLWAGEWSETLARWFVLAVLASLLLTAVTLHAWVGYIVGGAVLLGAYRLGGAPLDEEADEDLDDTLEAEEDIQGAYSPEDTLDLVWELIGDRNGVLLAQIKAQLQSETGTVWDSREVRALLDEAGVPVRPGVRVRGVGNSTGVHRDDVPPLPSRPSRPAPVDVVGAGQRPTPTPTNTAVTARLLDDGAVLLSIPDDQNPARTHVQVIPSEGVTKG